MLVLALDSSTRTGSIALARDGHVLESRVGDAAVRQAVRLPGDLVDLLAAHGAHAARRRPVRRRGRPGRIHRAARRTGHDPGPGDGAGSSRVRRLDAGPARRWPRRAARTRGAAGSAPGCTACAVRCSRRSYRPASPTAPAWCRSWAPSVGTRRRGGRAPGPLPATSADDRGDRRRLARRAAAPLVARFGDASAARARRPRWPRCWPGRRAARADAGRRRRPPCGPPTCVVPTP